MDDKIFSRIASKLVESEIISADDRELYEYGLKQVASTFATVATTLIIGFIFSMIWESILFMVSYIPLRSYAGGYHARTPLKCYVFSVVLTISVLLGIRYMPHDAILVGSLVLIASVVIFIFAPVADENKSLDAVEKKIFRKRARIILCAEVLLFALFWGLGLFWMSVCILASMFIASLMVSVGVLKMSKK